MYYYSCPVCHCGIAMIDLRPVSCCGQRLILRDADDIHCETLPYLEEGEPND